MSNSDFSEKLKKAIRDVKDFPKPGIVFKDITPIFQNPKLNKEVQDYVLNQISLLDIDVIIGIDSRGFIYGNNLAIALGKPFALVRKKGKLPYTCVEQSYALEYGESIIEMHTDAIQKGSKVLIHDDLLATGGTARAAAQLVNQLGGEVVGFSFLINLSFLEGEDILKEFSENIFSVVTY